MKTKGELLAEQAEDELMKKLDEMTSREAHISAAQKMKSQILKEQLDNYNAGKQYVTVSANSPQMAPYPISPAVFNPKEAHLAVEKAENGFVLTIANTKYIARDTEELKEIFITALVAQKLERL